MTYVFQYLSSSSIESSEGAFLVIRETTRSELASTLNVVYSEHFLPDFTGGLIHLTEQLLFSTEQLLYRVFTETRQNHGSERGTSPAIASKRGPQMS